MPAVSQTTATGDIRIDALLGDYRWALSNLTYSFPASASSYEQPYGESEPTKNFNGLNIIQQQVARAALSNFAAVANVTFTEVTGSNAGTATLRMAMSDTPSTAWAYLPNPAVEGGDIWFNRSSGYYDNPKLGNYAYTTFLHEIGHALGLEHPHEGGMPFATDAMAYSVMSYRSYPGASFGYTNESWGYAQSLMSYDIAAIQQIYGANFSHQSGDTTYSWSPTTGQMSINGAAQAAPGGNKIFQTVWDGGGTDTYDFSAYTNALNVDLRPGQWSTISEAQLAKTHYNGSQVAPGNIANALLYNGDLRSLVENAIGGSGNDTIIGNQAANRLFGGRGNDTLHGNGGSDMLFGSEGFDTGVFDFGLRGALSHYERGYLSVSSLGQSDRTSSIEQFQFTDKTVTLADGAPLVDDLFYLTRSIDVLDAGMESETHYALYGWREGRDPNGLFDTSEYLRVYKDVAAAGINPLDHYAQYGWREGRDPSGLFDTDAYLSAYRDVAAAKLNPLEHYLSWGIYEGRDAFADWLIT
jgi:serralysin